MSEVKKWHMPRGTSVSEGEDGEFVLASDYDALAADFNTLAQRLQEAERLLYEAGGELRTDRHHGLKPRIDAFLAGKG